VQLIGKRYQDWQIDTTLDRPIRSSLARRRQETVWIRRLGSKPRDGDSKPKVLSVPTPLSARLAGDS
jgi:hypothetical protein